MDEITKKLYNNVMVVYRNEKHDSNMDRNHICDDDCGNVYLIKEAMKNY